MRVISGCMTSAMHLTRFQARRMMETAQGNLKGSFFFAIFFLCAELILFRLLIFSVCKYFSCGDERT